MTIKERLRDGSEIKNDSVILTILVAAMALMLNHTVRAAGFNLSISDIFVLFIGLIMAISTRLFIPRYGVIYFSILVASTLLATLLIVPLVFEVQPSLRTVANDLIKIIVSFIYFVIGINLVRIKMHRIALKWFSYGTFAIALLGLAMEMSGIRIFRNVFYYGDLRFRGFMSDPNFYATLACAGIAYFSFAPVKVRMLKPFVVTVLAASVIFSGSKTGLLTLGALAFIVFFTNVKRSKNIVLTGFFVLTFAIVYPFLSLIRLWFVEIASKYEEKIPQLERISVLLLEDPSNALSGGGSTRGESWEHGISLIRESPIFGVGLGTYADINSKVFGSRTLAHNTYIQIAAEWGIILMSILFIWIGYMLLRSLRSKVISTSDFDLDISRSMIIVFLIGSITLSLNNARMFWLFLGIFVCLVYENSRTNEDVAPIRG